MGRHILFAVLSGLLVLGMSSAFAEEPQLSDQEILKAWGQAQTDVTEIAETTPNLGSGLKPLTDKELEKVDAGFRIPPGAHTYGLLTNQGCGVLCKTRPGRKGGTKGYGVIVNFTAGPQAVQ